MAMYAVILIMLPFLYFYMRRLSAESRANAYLPRGQVSRSRVPEIISSLSRVEYDPEKFRKENQCAICLIDYKNKDMIT